MNVFFDVDGVLIDGWHARPELRKPWDLDLERDLGLARETLQKALFLPSQEGGESLMASCIRGERDLEETLQTVLPDMGHQGSARELLDYWFANDSNVNQDVLDLVRDLRAHDGIGLYIATNQEHHRADHLWNNLRFRDFFDEIFYSARLGVTKNDPAFFAMVDAEIGRDRGDRPVFFDDTPAVVASAHRAGWDACLFESASDVTGHPRLKRILSERGS